MTDRIQSAISDDGVEDSDADEPQQRLSILRVVAAFIVVVALLGAGGVTLRRAVASPAAELSAPWFAPYVDTTLTPTYEFQSPANDPARQVVLGFVVADRAQACAPSWGTYYTLAQAGQALNLDRRISQVEANGGSAIISFGGQANTELADRCTTVGALETAYGSVISRYQSTTVDFDIEGAALSNEAAIDRRTAALKAIQHRLRAAGHNLAIWLTLPVEPNGLQDNAISVVRSMLRGGVDLAGVNVMTMDFGNPIPNMLAAVEASLTTTHEQLASLYRSYGVNLSSAGIWNRIGATAMVGQNDTNGEVFTVSDAASLVTFANGHDLGRISMWSLNRDRQCGSEFAQLGVHSNTCSGAAESPLGFTSIFDQLTGAAQDSSARQTSPPVVPNPIDNPVTSPYPIWQPGSAYVAGYKVVREGYVYQSKWYNQENDPAQQTQYSYETPWELVGPVLPTDHAPAVTTLPAGTYPEWSATAKYSTGQKVLRSNLPYTAKYYSQGSDPLASTQSASSPWAPGYTIPGEPPVPG